MNNPTPERIELTDEWVDVYALSGITPGTAVLVSLEGGTHFYLCEQETQPDRTANNIIRIPASQKQVAVDAGSVGLWARGLSVSGSTFIVAQIDY